jgi:FkbM family methyltransferase
MKNVKTDLIYDIGMNNGDDTAYYLYRGFRVVAVEADPKLVLIAKQRFANEISAKRLIILNIGITEQPGNLPFWVCETHSQWSSFDRSIASRNGSPHRSISVECHRFRTIIEEYGIPFYIKIDIEGNDYLCIEDLYGIELPTYISIEGGLDCLESLRDLGYERFKCISQFHYLPLEIPPSKEERYYLQMQRYMKSRSITLRVLKKIGLRQWLSKQMSRTRCRGDWVFPMGSSGPFGEELLGEWQSFEEMRKTYTYFKTLKANGDQGLFWQDEDYSFWTDIHAKKDGN